MTDGAGTGFVPAVTADTYYVEKTGWYFAL